jgi:hypothetical protein
MRSWVKITSVVLLLTIMVITGVAFANDNQELSLAEEQKVFTDDELIVLRKLAQKLLAFQKAWGKRSGADFDKTSSEYEESDGSSELFLPYPVEEVEAEEKLDGGWRRYQIPSKDEIKKHFSEVVTGVTETTKDIVEELKTVGSEWMDEQKGILQDLWTSVQELKTDIKGIIEERLVSENETSPISEELTGTRSGAQIGE